MSLFEHARKKLEFDTVLRCVQRYASSEPGRELIASLPISASVAEITSELSLVSELKLVLEEEGEFPLDGIHPVRQVVQKTAVEGTLLQPRDLLQIGATLRAARIARSFLSKRKEKSLLLWELAEPLHVDKVLEYNIEQAIDESGAVKAGASRELQSIRRAISEKYDQVRKKLESILKDVSELGFSQEEIITTREGRMVIPVKAEHKNRVHGFIHSASSSGATVFIEPTESLELNNDIRSLQFQEQREVERILKALATQVGDSRDKLLANLSVLARLDLLRAKAKYSIEILGVQPVVNASGPIKLIHARHPILMIKHGYKETVPLDLELGAQFTTLLISGPNAGGKSVTMKCVGLLVLMVQAGLHIPASDLSIVRIFKKMSVDIGDEQSIENDLSTFSSHLSNLKAIAEGADQDSLVLIDEIGSGTDPGEGSAIAASTLAVLTKKEAFTVATTHHGTLKVFAHDTPGVENGAMEFDQSTLTPTYRFKPGIPGSSYALEMAGRIGFSDDFLQDARSRLGHQQTQLEGLLAELERVTQKYRRDLEQLAGDKLRAGTLVKQYESKIAAQAKELRELKRQAIEEARGIVEQANTLIERSVREIKEQSAGREVVKELKEEVSRFKEEIRLKEKELSVEAEEIDRPLFAVGALVKLKGGGEPGEIENLSPDGKIALVVFGSVKMKIATHDLAPAKGAPRRIHSVVAPEKPNAGPKDLDLRGMTGEEAIPMVDKFLDDAVLTGLHRVDIIHGKGTGALRKKVTEFLSHHPRVKSFRLGEWNEGGTGATVVELVDE